MPNKEKEVYCRVLRVELTLFQVLQSHVNLVVRLQEEQPRDACQTVRILGECRKEYLAGAGKKLVLLGHDSSSIEEICQSGGAQAI